MPSFSRTASAAPVVFDVTAFGAVGDGVTNDTAAIRSAIAAANTAVGLAPATGAEVRCPRGTYLVDGLTLSGNGIDLVGDGQECTVIQGTPGTSPVVQIIGAGPGSTGAHSTTRRLKIIHDGNTPNVTGLLLQDFLHVFLQDVCAIGSGNGIDMRGVGNFTFVNVEGMNLNSPPAGTGSGLRVRVDPAGIVCGPGTFYGCQFSGGGPNGVPAARIEGTIATVFDACQFGAGAMATDGGVVMVDGAYTEVEFRNCHGESNGNSGITGCDFLIGSIAKPQSVRISGGWYFGNNGSGLQRDGIRVFSCGQLVVIGPTFGLWANEYPRSALRLEAGYPAVGDRLTVMAMKNRGSGILYSDASNVLANYGGDVLGGSLQSLSGGVVIHGVLGQQPNGNALTLESDGGSVGDNVQSWNGRALHLNARGNPIMLGGLSTPIGFYGAAPTGRQTVVGSRSDGTALTSLTRALAAMGLIVDQTTT